MKNNLLIIGASTYGVVAYEIAEDMRCFGKIDFVDDERLTTPNGIKVIGTTQDINRLASEYDNIIVAVGNSEVRLSLLERIEKETPYRIVSLISPKAYVSPSAQILNGCIIEPMAVIHTSCVINTGCIISTGAVVNHETICCNGVHVDCNATVEGYCRVPVGTKIYSGDVYKCEGAVKTGDLLFNLQKQPENLLDISKRTPKEIDGLEYTFESGM